MMYPSELKQYVQHAILSTISDPKYVFEVPVTVMSDLPWHDRMRCERLEFLGDAIIYALVSTRLFQLIPNGDPNIYTVLRSFLLSNLTFYTLKLKIDALLLSKQTGLPPDIPSSPFDSSFDKEYADDFESLIGHYYLKAGSEALDKWLGTVFRPLLDAAAGAYHFCLTRKTTIKRTLDDAYDPASKRPKILSFKEQKEVEALEYYLSGGSNPPSQQPQDVTKTAPVLQSRAPRSQVQPPIVPRPRSSEVSVAMEVSPSGNCVILPSTSYETYGCSSLRSDRRAEPQKAVSRKVGREEDKENTPRQGSSSSLVGKSSVQAPAPPVKTHGTRKVAVTASGLPTCSSDSVRAFGNPSSVINTCHAPQVVGSTASRYSADGRQLSSAFTNLSTSHLKDEVTASSAVNTGSNYPKTKTFSSTSDTTFSATSDTSSHYASTKRKHTSSSSAYSNSSSDYSDTESDYSDRTSRPNSSSSRSSTHSRNTTPSDTYISVKRNSSTTRDTYTPPSDTYTSTGHKDLGSFPSSHTFYDYDFYDCVIETEPTGGRHGSESVGAKDRSESVKPKDRAESVRTRDRSESIRTKDISGSREPSAKTRSGRYYDSTDRLSSSRDLQSHSVKDSYGYGFYGARYAEYGREQSSYYSSAYRHSNSTSNPYTSSRSRYDGYCDEYSYSR
ncbi:hypothetical protein JAAARDRAFT_199731 [Jaapia argillacea MUCL 33604]|uniref:RNase III domain-containing protein n=1 Tax=Jaapia argillacea MUCL 33604 TaxID=933084 RepID=A0A067P758_9AGAM|nr:hypothetical protein JAAARDRAFT_199731 [Jaapia argillacea MUCL 33604]